MRNRMAFFEAVFLVCLCVEEPPVWAADTPSPQWWERGQDAWCYKDDWKGLYLQNHGQCKKAVEIPEKAKAAYACVWTTGRCAFKINGQEVGSDCDDGTIEDYDIAKFLVVGPNTFEILGGGEAICEIGVVLDSGKEIVVGTDASWGGPNTRTSKERRGGPRGYGGDTHMARILTVTAEQRAKALINRLNSTRVRILDRDRFLFWRHSDPAEVLGPESPMLEGGAWEAIEGALEEARKPIAKAAELIKAGKFAEATEAAAPATAKTAEAEVALEGLMKRLAGREAQRAKALGYPPEGSTPSGGYVSFNGSAVNRLGWVVSTEPLDNDPAYWEFDTAPAGTLGIALAGLWKFQLDPKNLGLDAGCAAPEFDDSAWETICAPTKWGWERWGHTAENPAVKAINKPYNGHAWYRKRLLIPKDWENHGLVLKLGLRWGNTDWLAVNGEFIQPPVGPGSNADEILIPPKLIQPGKLNTLALRVFNNGNIGGLINPGLRLTPQGVGRLAIRRSPCGMGIARECALPVPPGGYLPSIFYSSALSPAVVVRAEWHSISLKGWTARGYAAPNRFGFISGAKLRARPFKDVDPNAMEENWLLIWNDQKGSAAVRPLLVVFEKRPEKIAIWDDGFGGVEVIFGVPGSRVVLVRPFDGPLSYEPSDAEVERCRLWSRAALRIPIGYLERVKFEGETCRVTMKYDYLEFKDDWGTKPLTLAPLPMLFSYAMEHKWPGAKVEGEVTDLGCRANSGFYPGSDCGTYKVIVGRDEVAYSFERMEPKVRYKGVGSLGEERRIGEPMFARVAEWGMNAFRPQIAFHGAGFFQHEGRGWGPNSKPRLSDETRAWFNAMVESHRRHGLMCFLNWFGLEGTRFAPWQRQQVIEFWREMARTCKDLPPGLVCYDLMNEPAGVYGATVPSKSAWADYNALVKEATKAIREIDKVHPISVEFGGGWAQPEDADMCVPTGDPNTIYQFHFYGPHTDDCHRNDLWYPRYKPAEERFESYEGWEERMLSPIRFMIRNHAQVMHGEFGISFLGPGDAPRAWLEDVLAIHEKYRMHWNWWNYSGGEIHRTGLVAGDRINPLVETLRKYAKMKPPGK